MAVDEMHPLYQRRYGQWRLMRDCIEGEDAIKARGTIYLPMNSGSTPEQYQAYMRRARFVNYTRRTLQGLHGLIFRRSPVVELPNNLQLQEIVSNIDKRGTTLEQFASDTVFDAMITGFGGILIDLPRTSGFVSKIEAEANGVRPYIRYYPAESVINWKTGVVHGYEQLTLVVLKEEVDSVGSDIFEHNTVTQYRVLSLDGDAYVQYLYDSSGNVIDKMPVVINGEAQQSIPFYFLPYGEPDTPMLYDLAVCNIGHYQKSADYENGVHLTTIPTGYVTGHRQAVAEDGTPEIVNLGYDSFLMFEEEAAKVGTLVFSGEGLLHSEKALETAMSDMAILGSRLVTPEKGTSESADSARIHRAGENATLAAFAKNMSIQFTKVLEKMCKWSNIKGRVAFELCTDYDTLSFDPNALNALANLGEAGRLPLPYLFFNLRNGEYTPTSATMEEYVTLLEMEASGCSPTDIVKQYRAMQSAATGVPSGEKQKDTNAVDTLNDTGAQK